MGHSNDSRKPERMQKENLLFNNPSSVFDFLGLLVDGWHYCMYSEYSEYTV